MLRGENRVNSSVIRSLLTSVKLPSDRGRLTSRRCLQYGLGKTSDLKTGSAGSEVDYLQAF